MSATPRPLELEVLDESGNAERLRATLAVVLRMLPTSQLDAFYENRVLLVQNELERKRARDVVAPGPVTKER